MVLALDFVPKIQHLLLTCLGHSLRFLFPRTWLAPVVPRIVKNPLVGLPWLLMTP